MADQNRENAEAPKTKRANAYDEPFGNEQTYEHVVNKSTEPVQVTHVAREEAPASSDEPSSDAPKQTRKASTRKPSSAKKSGDAGAKAGKQKTELRSGSTATPYKPANTVTVKNNKDKPSKNANSPRADKLCHQIIPYVLMLLGIFIGAALILNLFCNWQNSLENPSDHWMGIVGYGICYGLFGMFGPAAFAIPFLLFNLGLFWKRYIEHRLTISKIVASLVFMLVFSSLIHVFWLIGFESDSQRVLSALTLIQYGAATTGGGLIGGGIGLFLYTYCRFAGAIILTIILLAASLFYLLGMTPQHAWSYLRNRRKKRAPRRASHSEEHAEEAENRAKMEEKIRRIKGDTQDDDEKDFENGAPLGAVRVVRSADAKKASDEKIAPMPQPRLDPNDGEDVFVPEVVNEKMAAVQEEETLASELAIRQGARAEAERRARMARARAAAAAAAAPQPAASQAAGPINPAANRDAAVEPIFPKMSEPRQSRRAATRTDRSFDLKNVFIDIDNNDVRRQQPQHAPVPPEVPLPAGRARPAAARPAAAPTTAAPGTAPAAPAARSPHSVANTIRTPGAPVTRVARPTDPTSPARAASKPLPKAPAAHATGFEQVAPQKQDFGLTNEEFERLEAQQVTLPRSGATRSAAAKDTPVKESAAASKSAEAASPKSSAKPATKKYIFPPISYLHPGEPMTEENRAELEASMNALALTLKSFHVGIEDNIRYACGPTVTRYEITPAAGVRVRSITNLSDDIALALRSSGGVRIEAPIPGTNSVGIEVPNRTRSTIYLRELIESKAFSESKTKLTACLGAGIAGEPLVFDIAKMPHLLIAGTTGSGKSVCINCIVMSLLYKVTPDEVKLVMIDPKKVEFSIYKNIPHLMAPVVTTPKDAAGALQASVEEMERRFELFEQVGVRDLKGYNTVTADDPDMPSLPHIVIIIDELADLMMTARDEVETAICRIAQKARAAGMHLIIGTQRPSADVVTGLIKSNVPSRIAFAVKSQVDSRVILDHIGAESLTGRGDMLFVPIGSMRDTRVQGAFVDDKEVEKICEFIRATNGTAVYDEKFISKLKELAAQCGNKGRGSADISPVGGEDGEKVADQKYADAVRIAIEEKRISTSLLQRKLEIGYSRAAKLIDRMQAEGYVSPPDGSKPRTILITPEQYMEKFVDNPDGAAE